MGVFTAVAFIISLTLLCTLHGKNKIQDFESTLIATDCCYQLLSIICLICFHANTTLLSFRENKHWEPHWVLTQPLAGIPACFLRNKIMTGSLTGFSFPTKDTGYINCTVSWDNRFTIKKKCMMLTDLGGPQTSIQTYLDFQARQVIYAVSATVATSQEQGSKWTRDRVRLKPK